MTGSTLPRLSDEAFTSVLAVAAHPDDLEYGTSAAVARWTAQGKKVSYLMLTRGEAGMDGVTPDAAGVVRSEEEEAAAAAVGVDSVTFLAYPDGAMEYSLAVRRDIARMIRRQRPDAVLVGSWEVVATWGLNQADHRVAGLATIDAVRDAGNRWVFRELVARGLQPHSVKWLLVAGDPHPTHAVDVTGEPLRRGIASLMAHRRYLECLPWHPDPSTTLTGVTAEAGRAAGVANAVPLRVWDLRGSGPTQELDASTQVREAERRKVGAYPPAGLRARPRRP